MTSLNSEKLDLIIQRAKIADLKEQKIGRKFFINMIKDINTKFGKSFMLYDKKHDCIFYANSQLKAYLQKVIESLRNIGSYYVKDDELSLILEFEIQNITKKDNRIQVDLNFVKHKRAKIILSDSDNERKPKKDVEYHQKKTKKVNGYILSTDSESD